MSWRLEIITQDRQTFDDVVLHRREPGARSSMFMRDRGPILDAYEATHKDAEGCDILVARMFLGKAVTLLEFSPDGFVEVEGTATELPECKPYKVLDEPAIWHLTPNLTSTS